MNRIDNLTITTHQDKCKDIIGRRMRISEANLYYNEKRMLTCM